MSIPPVSGIPYKPQEVPLLDVVRDNTEVRDEMLARITQVLDSGRFLHGPDVRELEAKLAELCGTQYGISCASGSDAVLLSLMACCVGQGDEVIVPSFTFFATASAVARLGANIVFVDIDPATFNLAPELVENAITSRTKAIVPVHLFGQCAAMDRITAIGRQYDIAIIEDAAQAVGAVYQGRPAGAWGDVGCFSFYPTKNLGACGDAGMLTTSSEEWSERLRLLAAHGMSPRYYHKVVGINSRLDSMQAAVLNVKLSRLEVWSSQRRSHAARYAELFAETGLDQVVGLPQEAEGCRHVWNQYTIRVPEGKRDVLRAHLADAGVGSEIYYPCPLHLQDCFEDVGFAPGSLPQTELAANEVLSLPIFPGLTDREQLSVVGRIADFYAARSVAA